MAMKLIEHTRGGYIIRKAGPEEFDDQAEFTELQLLQQEIDRCREPPMIGSAEDINTWRRFAERDEEGQSRFGVESPFDT